MKKTILKNIALLLIFAITATSIMSIKASLAITLNNDLNPSLNPTPDLVKTLNDGINLKDFYSGNTTSFAPFEAKLDEFFYHQLDTTFTDLVEYMTANPKKTAQDAIDYAKAQQTTKGGDPAALKTCNDSLTTCTTTLKTYTDAASSLRSASTTYHNNAIKQDTLKEPFIPTFVEAFINYAITTGVFAGLPKTDPIFKAENNLENYFNSSNCILPLLRDFYDQTLSAVASNTNISSSWNIKVDLTPTNKSISDNMSTLIANIGTLKGTGACGAPLSLLSTYLQSKKPNTIKYIASSHLVSPANDANYFQNLTQNDYKVMIENTMYLLNNITDVLFGNDSEYTKNKQAWFDIHPIIDVGTASNLSVFSLNDTLANRIKSFDLSAIKNAFIKDHTYELTFVSEVNNAITNRNNANYLKDSGDYPTHINNMIILIESVTDKLFANDSNYKNKEQAWFDKHIIATTQTTRDTGIPNLKDTINSQLDAVLAAQNNTQPAAISSTVDKDSLTTIETALKTLVAFVTSPNGDLYKKATSKTKTQTDVDNFNSAVNSANDLLDTLKQLNSLSSGALTDLDSITVPNFL